MLLVTIVFDESKYQLWEQFISLKSPKKSNEKVLPLWNIKTAEKGSYFKV